MLKKDILNEEVSRRQKLEIQEQASYAQNLSDIIVLIDHVVAHDFYKSDAEHAVRLISSASGIPLRFVKAEYEKAKRRAVLRNLTESRGETWEQDTPAGYATVKAFALSGGSACVTTGFKKDFVRRGEYFLAYRQWAASRGLKPLGKMTFFKHIEASNDLRFEGVYFGFDDNGNHVVRGVAPAPILIVTTEDDEL